MTGRGSLYCSREETQTIEYFTLSTDIVNNIFWYYLSSEAMEKEKLRKIAYVAVHSTGNEARNARRILKLNGVDDPNLLLENEPEPEPDIPEISDATVFDVDLVVDDLENAIKKYLNDGISKFLRGFRF